MRLRLLAVLCALSAIVGCGCLGGDSSSGSVDFSTAELTPENVTNAVRGNLGNDIQVDVSDGHVRITIPPETSWNEEHMIKLFAWGSTDALKILFSNPQVNLVTIIQEATFTDTYGSEKTENAAFVRLSRETANKINWDNFKIMVTGDYSKLFDIADSYRIHPAIMKNL